MSYQPCQNPQCKSYGSPHPNCRCHGGLAKGGVVQSYCSSDRAHSTSCGYYAEGGMVDFDSLQDDSALDVENPQAQLAARGAQPIVNAVSQVWNQGGQNIHNALASADQGNYAGLQDMAVGNAMSTIGAPGPKAPLAKFIGYQETGEAGKAIPLFNVLGEGHPLNNSTVGLNTLAEHGIEAPQVPTFEQWNGSQAPATPLDMSEAARMARAKDMGFDTDTTFYHGSPNPEFTAFSPSKKGSTTGADDAKLGYFFTKGRSNAEGYRALTPDNIKKYGSAEDAFMQSANAPKGTGHVLEVNLKMQNPMQFDNWDQYGEATNDAIAAAIKEAKANGYDSLIIPEHSNGHDTVVVFKNNQIRKSSAAFDPKHAKSSKLSFAEGGAVDFDSLQADSPNTQNSVPIPGNLSQFDQNKVGVNSVTSFDDLQDDSDKYGTAGQQGLAALEGGAEGLLGPLAPAAELATGLTTPEAMRGRAEANPWTHGGAKAATFMGSMLAGTGEAALVAKAGEAIAKGANLSSKIGSAALRGATEMGLLQSSDELTRSIVQDLDASVQTALTDVGLAALLGAGGGAAFSAVAPLWEATLGNKAGKLIEDFKGRIDQHVNHPNMADAVSSELQEHYDNVKNIAHDVYGPTGLKSRDIAKSMPEMHEGISTQTSEIGEKLAKSVNKMVEKPYSYPERLVGKIQDDIGQYESIIQKPESTPDQIFNATQDLKQTLQGYSKFGKLVAPHDEAYDFIRETKNLAHTLRESLEDESVWKNAAIRQKEINKAFTQFKPALESFERKFTAEVPDLESGGMKRIIDPGKMSTYINQLGKPSAEIKQGMLKDFLTASDKYSEVLNKSHYNLGMESPFTHSPMAVTRSTLDEVTPGMALADIFIKKGLGDAGSSAIAGGIGSSIGATIGHGTGIPYAGAGGGALGAILGEKTLSPMIRAILPAIMKPLLEGRADANALKAAAEYGSSILKGDTMMTKAAKNLFKSGAEVLPLNMIPNAMKREQLTKLVANLQNDPGSMPSNSHVAGYMPDHGVALGATVGNATRYIASQMPDKSRKNPLDSAPIENPVQKAQRANTLNIAQQPLVVYSKVKDGTVTQQDVQALNAMYPALYNKMKTKVSQELATHLSKGGSVPYQTRIGLSIFMGQPMDSTFTGMSILAAQPQGNQPAQQQAPQQSPGKPPSQSSMKGLNKLPQQYQTPSQASQQRAVNHK